MIIRDVVNSKAIALNVTENKTGRKPYLGVGFFPVAKKAGLDLKWIKTSKGLPVSLAPSTFDAKATLRSREGIKFTETEMPFFREGVLLKEQDRMDIQRAVDGADALAIQALDSVFDDANNLIDGAEVVAERMRWSLLSAPNGKPSISIQANGATYSYDYDPSGAWGLTNYLNITDSNDKWSAATAKPLDDVRTMCDKVEENTGSRPEIMVVSRGTMNNLLANDQVKSAILAQNATANIYMTDETVKAVFRQMLEVELIVYSKKYKNEEGTVVNFLADGTVVLVPSGSLGKTWYGQTPEEIVMGVEKDFDVTLFENRIAVAVQHSLDPVQTKTIASEVVLPSYERMDEVAVIKAY